MTSNSSPITIPSYRKILLEKMKNSRMIWSFNPLDFELKPFHWYVFCCIDYRARLKLKLEGRPVDDGKRVPPDMWLEYRVQNKFQGPHCLCPLLRMINEDPRPTEAEIVLKGSGDYVGEYIAECPNRRCGYFGQFPVAFQDEESVTRRKK